MNPTVPLITDIQPPSIHWEHNPDGSARMVIASPVLARLTRAEYDRVAEAMRSAVETTLASSVGAADVPVPSPRMVPRVKRGAQL